MNTLRMAPLTALLILCWSQSLFAEEATGWDYKNKNAFVTQCHQRAMQELRPFIKGIFIEVMDETQFSVYQLLPRDY